MKQLKQKGELRKNRRYIRFCDIIINQKKAGDIVAEQNKQLNFEKNLYNASSICEGKFCYSPSGFSRIYSFATENVAGYIDYFDFENKSLLTVGSSGDQVLNAFYNGARDITLFDINEYAKYYVYLSFI